MSKKILIIDDDMDLCTLLARFLTRNEYEVEMAHSGSKGIAKFNEGQVEAANAIAIVLALFSFLIFSVLFFARDWLEAE